MNRKQLQIEVCKGMLNPDKNLAYAEVDCENVAITTDGASCYVFSKRECIFDITKIRLVESLANFFTDNENDVEIKSTGKLSRSSNGYFVEKFAGNGFNVYVDTKYIKLFAGNRYYTNGARNRILVKDQLGRLIGLFLPIRHEESEVETDD